MPIASKGNTMRTVRFHSYGGPDVLVVDDVPVIDPAPGQVLVDVAAAGVAGGEPAIRAGRYRLVMRRPLPSGTGVDFSGTVAQIGAGVDHVTVGEHVWGVMPHGTFGAAAEQLIVPFERLTRAPSSIDLVDAAALPAAGTTALRALEGLQPGAALLVRGAAGGVGNVVLQLASAHGAHITTLASARDADWLRTLGADETVDYRTTRIRDLPRFDRIIDLVGTELPTLRRRLRAGGTLVALALDARKPLRTLATIVGGRYGSRRIVAFSNNPSTDDLRHLTRQVDAGHLQPVVADRRPLEGAADAHRDLERGGVRGKILLIPA